MTRRQSSSDGFVDSEKREVVKGHSKASSTNKRKRGSAAAAAPSPRRSGRAHPAKRINYNAKYHPLDEATRPSTAQKLRHSYGDFSQPHDLTADTSSDNDQSTNDEEADVDEAGGTDDRIHSNEDEDAGEFSEAQPQAEDVSISSSAGTVLKGSKRVESLTTPDSSHPQSSRTNSKQESTARTSSTAGTARAYEVPPAYFLDIAELQGGRPLVTLQRVTRTTMTFDYYAEVYSRAWEDWKSKENNNDRVKRLRTSYIGAWETARTKKEAIDEDVPDLAASPEDPLDGIVDEPFQLFDQPLFPVSPRVPNGDSPRREGYAPWQQNETTSFEHPSKNRGRVIEDSQDGCDPGQLDEHHSQNASQKGVPHSAHVPSQELLTVSPGDLQLQQARGSDTVPLQSTRLHSGDSSVSSQVSVAPRSEPGISRGSSQTLSSTSIARSTGSISNTVYEDVPTQPSDYKDRHELLYLELTRSQHLPVHDSQPRTPIRSSNSHVSQEQASARPNVLTSPAAATRASLYKNGSPQTKRVYNYRPGSSGSPT